MSNAFPVLDRYGDVIEAGAKVLVPAGTELYGTFPKRTRTVKRDTTVKVYQVSPGWPATSPHRDDQGRASEIIYAGSGGYWHHVQADLVTLVDVPCEACQSGERNRTDHVCAASKIIYQGS